MAEKRTAFLVAVETEGKRLLGRTSHAWEDNIIIDLTERGWEEVDRILLLRWPDSLNTEIKFSGSIKCWEFLQ
jgi:hypothetical protein